jgi:hypothetical protein
MTRISPSPTPVLDAERTADRAPAGSRGAFRAALRAAGKDKAPARPAGGDDIYTITSQSPMAAAATLERSRGGSRTTEAGELGVAPTSIAGIAAPSFAEPIGTPIGGPGARAGTSTRDPARGRLAIPIADFVGDLGGAPTAAPAPDAARSSGQASSDRAVDAPGEILLDTMLANAGIATAAGAPRQPPAPAIVVESSPVATWVAASIARAVGSLGRTASGQPPSPVAGGDVQVAPAATAGLGAIAGAAAPPAATPLEQAVHDLIGQVIDRIGDRAGERAGERDDELASTLADARDLDMPLPVFAAHAASARAAHDGGGSATAPAHPAREAELPEPPANPSHVHLVLDEGPERTVVTVAVRGSEVHVALRSHDDATAAALARNAGSLDHAMRARGLELGELIADRDPSGQRPPRDPEPRERQARDAERFTLEEMP